MSTSGCQLPALAPVPLAGSPSLPSPFRLLNTAAASGGEAEVGSPLLRLSSTQGAYGLRPVPEAAEAVEGSGRDVHEEVALNFFNPALGRRQLRSSQHVAEG